mmetsp:Transcript_10799/g.16586  ORF Transcript_10799/g.16586 Transcript_10799/m.16586 type:complete len:105 (-) Transcript_10799:546-860(-)
MVKHNELLNNARIKALSYCSNLGLGHEVQRTGGWCLEATKKESRAFVHHPNGVSYAIPVLHVPPSQAVLNGMINLFKRENVSSITEFGASVAATVQSKHNNGTA